MINVASSAALMALGETSMYSASKAAVKGLTEAMREELRGEAYIGLVCPGFTKTDIFRNQGETNGMDLINMVSTPCHKAVNTILKGILRVTVTQWEDSTALCLFRAQDFSVQ